MKDNQFQGCNHFNYAWSTTAPVNGFPKSYGYDNKKTLLDEFAMAAMVAIIRKTPPCTCEYYEEDELNSPCNMAAGGAYSYAASMMKERNRRDEMGNVKEAEEQ